MAVSKYGWRDWLAGFRIPFGTSEGWAQATVLVDENGTPVTIGGGGATQDTNITEIGGNTVDTGGLAGVLALGGPGIPGAVERLPSSAATTNATGFRATAAWVFLVAGYNTNAAVIYLKLYDKASAPVVGTDIPFLTIPLVPNAGFAINLPPIYFSAGIGFALTTGAADNDTGAVGAGDIVGLNIVYN